MIDSHCHIYRDEYDEDRLDVIQRASMAGVSQILTIGCNVEESKAAVALAEQYPGIYASVGVHPHEARTFSPQDLIDLIALADHPKVLAFGEIGLDYAYDNSPRDVQKRVFAQQMEAVQALNKPVVIHSRDAEQETLNVMRAFPIARSGHAHCFTGSQHLANALLDLGYFLGFTGIITFKNANDLRSIVQHTPLDRILIETDSPYLAPVPFRGRRNEPCYVAYVCQAIADIKHLEFDRVEEQTSLNFYGLYGTPGVPLNRLSHEDS